MFKFIHAADIHLDSPLVGLRNMAVAELSVSRLDSPDPAD